MSLTAYLASGLLQIQFSEIPEEGLRLRVNDASWFPDGDVARCGDPEVVLHLKRSGERVLVSGSIEVAIVSLCDRCLEEFVRPMKIDFQLVLEVSGPEDVLPDRQNAEYEFDPGQIEVLFFDGRVIDLADLLSQQMILAMPQKNLCRFDCLGICEHCGASLNLEKCGCLSKFGVSPFGSLNHLLKKQ